VFSNMTLTAERRQTFIARYKWFKQNQIKSRDLLIVVSSVVKFLLQYDFDGLSLDWQYPAMRDGRPDDRPNFTLLVKVIIIIIIIAARHWFIIVTNFETNFDPVNVEGKTYCSHDWL
jgi:hypothetical protein